MTSRDPGRNPVLFGLFNRAVEWLLRSGVRAGPAHLLSVEGRSSGVTRSTPVSPLEYAGKRYLVASHGGADWVKNIRAARRAVLSRERRSEKVGAVEVDPRDTAPILKEFVTRMRGSRHSFQTGPDSPVEAFKREAYSHPVFELVLDPGKTQ